MALSGIAAAQYGLGQILARGSGVPQDIYSAYMWFKIAASNGHLKAIDQRDNLTRQLSDDQLKKAHARATRCKGSNYKYCE